MTYDCKRCKKHGELHKAPVTEGSTGRYTQLRNSVNASAILELKQGRNLCPECLANLAKWIQISQSGA